MTIDHSTYTDQDKAIHAAIDETLYPSVAREGVLTYHDDYTSAEKHLRLVRDAFHSDGGFLDIPEELVRAKIGDAEWKESKGHLDYFSVREDEDRYQLRRKRAYFVSMMRTLASIPVTYITTTGIHRNFDGLPQDPREIVKSMFGSWDEAMKFLMTQSVIYSVILGGIDRSSKAGKTRADDLSNPPILNVLTPLQVPDWDIIGSEFRWLKHFEPSLSGRGHPMKPQESLDDIRIWTKDEWVKYSQNRDKNGKIVFHRIGGGPNLYHEVPFRPLWSSPPLTGLYGSKEPWQVAKVARRAFNLSSEIDDQLVGCMFNILVKPEIDGVQTPVNAGSGTTLSYDPQHGSAPSFIAPDPAPVKVGFESMDRLKRYCYEIMRLSAADTGTKPATAVQRLFESEETNKVVRDLAQQAEGFERNLLRLFVKAIGEDPEKYEKVIKSSDTLRYPRNFNPDILSDNRVDRFVKLFKIPWISNAFKCELEKHAAITSIPMSEDAREVVIAEIDKAYKEMEDPTRGIEPEAMENPEISKRLSKPFTDRNDLSSDTGGIE